MKKNIVVSIILNIVLVLSLVLLIVAFVFVLQAINTNYILNILTRTGFPRDLSDAEIIKFENSYELKRFNLINTFIGIAAIVNFIAIILVDLPFIKKLFLLIKNRCSTAKSQRAEAKKQARIAQLQADLEELKKD